MSIRKKPFVPKEYYHIYNRGNSKQKIFHDEEDYRHFVNLLFISNSEKNFKLIWIDNNVYNFNRGIQLVGIGSYCLMPNHFHLLITQTEEGSVSKFMQKLSTAYSMYYNKKYDRTGALFEGKFKSEHAHNDNYLRYLFSYIHLNIMKLINKNWKEEGIKNKQQALNFLDTYKYSSYLDYTGVIRKENAILNKEMFPNYFPSVKSFKQDIFDWLKISL